MPGRRRYRARQARAGRRVPRTLEVVAAVLLVAAIAWSGGLLWFIGQIPRDPATDTATTDAIVVLTGGQLRLDTGIALLKQGRGRKLFVSGVHQGVDVEQILRLARESPDALRCCIVLGHEATDTRGNARETALWVAAESLRSIRLVTANYHLPRSLIEFTRAMPGVRVVPHPVFPDQVRVETWWQSPGTAALLAGEYGKYLVALLRGGL